MEEILKGQDDRIKDQINKLKEQDQVIRELMKKIEQLENENRYLRSLAEMPALRLNFH